MHDCWMKVISDGDILMVMDRLIFLCCNAVMEMFHVYLPKRFCSVF